MQPSTLVLCLLAAAGIVAKVTCLTNGELYELLKENAKELELSEIKDGEAGGDGDDVITLPGDADQEIDIGDLIEKMAAVQAEVDLEESSEPSKKSSGVSWSRRRRRRRRRPRPHPRRKLCHCSRHKCKCCVKKTYQVNLLFKKVRFRFSGCIVVRYLSRRHGFDLSIYVCGRRVYYKQVSLRRGISLCYGIPGLKRFAKACFVLYNINLSRKRICAKITGQLNLVFKKFRIHFRIGCFRIPMAEEKMNVMLGDPDNWGYEQLPQLTEDVGDPEGGTEVEEAEDEEQDGSLSFEEADEDLDDLDEEDPSPIDMTDFE